MSYCRFELEILCSEATREKKAFDKSLENANLAAGTKDSDISTQRASGLDKARRRWWAWSKGLPAIKGPSKIIEVL